MELEESSQASPETGEVAQHPPTPRNLSNSVTGSAPSTFAFLSLPAELRASILTACITPNHDRKEGDKTRCPCSWYLSHTMPQSLFGVSRQLREEALCVLSTYLTVICHVRPHEEAEGWIRWPELCYPPGPSSLLWFVKPNHCPKHGSVHRQYVNLGFQSKRLRLCLHLDKTKELVEELEGTLWTLKDVVFLAVKFWTRENCWEHVEIDLDGMHEAMLARTNTDERGVEPNEFDDWVRGRLEAIVERLRPLIDNAARSNVKLKGWNKDGILKVLETKEGQGVSKSDISLYRDYAAFP